MTLTIYRVTNPGDVLGTVPANEKIVFNETDDVNSPNAFIKDYEINNTTGIGNNQAAEQDLGDHQDLGSVENLYAFRGFISQRDKSDATTQGLNPFTEILKKWDEEPKTNTDFKHGRFGVDMPDHQSYSIVPVGTGTDQVGLIWKGIRWGPLEYTKNPLPAYFEIFSIVDKGDDQ